MIGYKNTREPKVSVTHENVKMNFELTVEGVVCYTKKSRLPYRLPRQILKYLHKSTQIGGRANYCATLTTYQFTAVMA